MDKERIKQEIDKKIEALTGQGISSSATIDSLDKLIDMKKDLLEIEKMEKTKYRGGDGNEYGNYGNYSEGGYGARGNYREGGYNEGSYNEGGYSEGSYGRRRRDSRGRYMERGVDSKYQGEEVIEEIDEQYKNYSEGREQYGRGNYGAEEQTMKSLEYMLESVVEFIKMLEKEASSQQEVNLIKKYTKKIAEM